MRDKVTLMCNADGILGRYPDEYDEMEEGDILIDVTVDIPDELFKPLQLVVEVPPNLVPSKPFRGSCEAVQVPVTLYEPKVVEGEVTEELQPARGGILALIKRFLEKKND